MIHDWLRRRLGARRGGWACVLVYALMLLAILHFWDRPAAALAYLH